MGNWIFGRRRGRRPVEDRLTRPQRLSRQLSNVDYKKLRKLIVSGKLAPCFDALEEARVDDLEECPICFFYYPSLNRSRCCEKGICTECFLQMKPSDASQQIQCPYCKYSCYAVEYRGERTMEEKGLDLAEEQIVIEAKIRMQFESQNEKRVVRPDQSHPISDIQPPSSTNVDLPIGPVNENNVVAQDASQIQESTEANSTRNTLHTRHDAIHASLEEVMLMETIWESIQDSRAHKSKNKELSESSDTAEPGININSEHSNSKISASGDGGEAYSSKSSTPENNIQQDNHIDHMACATVVQYHPLKAIDVGSSNSRVMPSTTSTSYEDVQYVPLKMQPPLIT
ncbi:hypothetical protein J5N97_002603 [Dioscorea zingiberensis]|uniref:RING-type domain-containing protein n=1 Tax=Dioscorea zingiberensis TaxID=325984 RepID=A0A9D5D4F2_9LILI|nr:hypothetical protein J5N97_002603 [Dioscorea zingiberensis]